MVGAAIERKAVADVPSHHRPSLSRTLSSSSEYGSRGKQVSIPLHSPPPPVELPRRIIVTFQVAHHVVISTTRNPLR